MNRARWLPVIGALLAVGCSDDSGTGPELPPGECSDAPAAEKVWSFDDGYEGWSADSLTTNQYNTARWDDGRILLRGRGEIDGTPDAWIWRSVTLPNSCELTLSYRRDGVGLSTGYLRIRYESGGADHLVDDWTAITGSGSEGTRSADLSEWAGTSGTLIFEWEDQEDAGGEQDPGSVWLFEIAIR